MRTTTNIHQQASGPMPRTVQAALALIALAWAAAAGAIAARAARGISVRFQAGALESILESLFLLFLVVVGLRALDRVATRGRYLAQIAPLPARPGRLTEWGVGAAVGWALALAVVLPLLLSGHLHARLMWQRSSLVAVLLALATLLVVSLTEEIVFRGYVLRRFQSAFGPSTAATLTSIAFALSLLLANRPVNPGMALIDGTLLGLLLAMAYLRTHALWLGWGLHFAYRAVTAVLLGLPIAGHGEFGSIADTFAGGPRWLSGGAFGLDAAFLTAPILMAAMIVLYRATRDYAWRYTHAPIVAAGYEVTVAPPTAHVAMERAAPPPPPLVQILPTTPQAMSTRNDSPDT